MNVSSKPAPSYIITLSHDELVSIVTVLGHSINSPWEQYTKRHATELLEALKREAEFAVGVGWKGCR